LATQPKPRKPPTPTFPQTGITANFYDAARDDPKENFEQITRRRLGAKGFPKTKRVRVFKRECRKAFDLGGQP
jgi:hypothetical protein